MSEIAETNIKITWYQTFKETSLKLILDCIYSETLELPVRKELLQFLVLAVESEPVIIK